MKAILRNFLINLGALWVTSQAIPALSIDGGIKGLAVGALAFMGANIILVPLIKILLLPLNLLTLGILACQCPSFISFDVSGALFPTFTLPISRVFLGGIYYSLLKFVYLSGSYPDFLCHWLDYSLSTMVDQITVV